MDVGEDDDINSREDEGFVMIANELLDKCNIRRKICNLTECSDAFFIAVYQGLLADDLKGIIKNPISHEDRAKNCQSVIDALASGVLDVDLCHITGNNVVSGDRTSIRNLLEIFAGLLEYFLEYAEGNDDEISSKDADEDDSNLLTAEHHIISGVLREELGSPFKHATSGQINSSTHTQTRNGPTQGRETAKSHTYTQLPGVVQSAKSQRDGVDAPSHPPTHFSVTQNSGGGNRLDTSSRLKKSIPTPLSGQTGSLTDTDSSKVSDSTAELIRLGEMSSSSSSSKHLQGRNESAPSASDASGSQGHPHSKSVPSRHPPVDKPTCDRSVLSGSAIPDNTAAVLDLHSSSLPESLTGNQTYSDCGTTDIEASFNKIETMGTTASRVATSPEQSELTQYTLEVSSKQDPQVPSSFMLGSSASWSELISPLDPVRDGSNGLSGFESLGVRPRSQPPPGSRGEPVSTETKMLPVQNRGKSTISSEGRAVHHYHHHFHHGAQSVPEPSVAIGEQAAVSASAGAGLVLGPDSTSAGSAAASSQSSNRITTLNCEPPQSEPTSNQGLQNSDARQPQWLEKLRSSRTGNLPGPSSESQEDWGSGSSQSTAARVPPPVRRQMATELLTKYRAMKPVLEGAESSSEDEEEGEELSQFSDSAVDYGSQRYEHEGLCSNGASRLPSKQAERALKTSSRRPRRGVTFNDDVETIPVTSRMDRLRRLLDEEERDQRKQQAEAMRTAYREQLRDLQREERKARQPKRRKDANSPNARVASKKRRNLSAVQPRGRLEAIYRPHPVRRRGTHKRGAASKARKRSASASPVMRRRRASPDRQLSDVFGAKDALLPAMFDEFPFLHVSPQTAHNMWTKQARQLSALLKPESQNKRTTAQQMLKEAERRQEALATILNKELEHGQRMREQRERQEEERSVRHKLRDKRHASARARRYFYDYQLRMRSKMLKRRTREEQIFKKLFEDGLQIQKERIRELRQYAKEKREAHARRQQDEIQSMENYYRDQFSMLAESIARERCDVELRENAQEKVMRQMRRELRHKIEREIQDFQENLTRDQDSAYFRQLEADRLRRELQLAAFKTNF